MKVKYWALVGILFVVVIIGSYTVITGANPFESSDRAHEEHTNEEKTSDHQHHQIENESEITTHVLYNNKEIEIELKDIDGKSPVLKETHEKEMHLIIVSSNLEKFIHLHPERVKDGIYKVPMELEDGRYKAFIDIAPVEKAYVVRPNELHVGESHHQDTTGSLSVSEDWTEVIDGKTVTLQTENLRTEGTTKLSFDLHGEQPLPYLGALGHVVILDEDAEEFIHVHPTSENETIFETHFEQPGLYKVWAEFKYEDAGVITYPFVIQIEK